MRQKMFEGTPQINSNFKGEDEVRQLRIFEDSSKNLEKLAYFVLKIALKAEVFRGSLKK